MFSKTICLTPTGESCGTGAELSSQTLSIRHLTHLIRNPTE